MARITEFLGEPIIPTGAERVSTSVIRASLATRTDKATDHLGEAKTMAVITTRGLDAIFVTDDVPAARHARTLNVHTMSTAELLRLGVRTHRIPIEQAWKNIEYLRGKGRTLPHCPLTLGQFRRWCEAN
jgi:predicted nucleic acid-binding protein